MIRRSILSISFLCFQMLLCYTPASSTDMEAGKKSDALETPGLIGEKRSIVALRSIKQMPEDIRRRFLPLLNSAADRYHFDLFLEGNVKGKFELVGGVDATVPGDTFYVWSVYNQKGALIAKRSVKLDIKGGTIDTLSDADLDALAKAAISAITSSLQPLPAVSSPHDSPVKETRITTPR
jgi:hypothetical protein